MEPHHPIGLVIMSIVLNSMEATLMEKEQAIRNVPDDRDPGNLSTPAPTPASTPAPPTEKQKYVRDCGEIQDRSAIRPISGVYKIKPLGVEEPFEVFCDFDVDGGGWTVIQRRIDGSVDFLLLWDDYKEGFGNLETEFWLGNDKIYSLTREKRYQLRIELTNVYGLQFYAKYSYFAISDEDDYYQLSIGSFSGNVGKDAMAYHNGMPFSTEDADHDQNIHNCAVGNAGGWWYKSCGHSQLNGRYQTNYFYWVGLPGFREHIKFSEMKIRAV